MLCGKRVQGFGELVVAHEPIKGKDHAPTLIGAAIGSGPATTPAKYAGCMTGSLVILRHGQSTWNELNLFTGWHDVDLTILGRTEATAAGVTMLAKGCTFDVAHTSLQSRAVLTCNLALAAMDMVWLPVQRHWRLNERHYGALQGLDKLATTQKYGAEQTKLWRRSYDVAPPPIDLDSPEHARFDAEDEAGCVALAAILAEVL